MKWSNVSDCDAESDASDDNNDQEEDTESVAKEDEVVSVIVVIVQEVFEDDPVEVKKYLQSISHQGIADSKTSEKLGNFKKSLAPVKLNSAMPCYAFTSTDRNAEETCRKIFLHLWKFH